MKLVQFEEKDLPVELPAKVKRKLLDEGLLDVQFLHKSGKGELIKFVYWTNRAGRRNSLRWQGRGQIWHRQGCACS